jgi:hypothetical protein
MQRRATAERLNRVTSDARPYLPPRTPLSRRAALIVSCALVLASSACFPSGEQERPESIAVTSSQGNGGGPATPGKPSARWVHRGKTIALTLFGSSTCPPVPIRLQTEAASHRITVTISEDYEGACTADLAPYTSVVQLSEEMDPQLPIDLIIRQADQADVRVRL